MIVQSGPVQDDDGKRFVIKMEEHLDLVDQLARSFGNAQFKSPEPREEFLYVCRTHDVGWRDLDENPPLDPETGLPYNLGQTPMSLMMLSSSNSPEHNEARHPYCGLINSMHIWGLYNGRYGYSDRVLLDLVADEDRPLVDSMLDLEFQRQGRLKASLADDSETAPWVEEQRLFANYKVLQFFDTLALYFNCTHETRRTSSTFENVPRDVGDDVTVGIRPAVGNGDRTYQVTPFPFGESPLEVSFAGRFLAAQDASAGPDMTAAMRDTPVTRETATLVAG